VFPWQMLYVFQRPGTVDSVMSDRGCPSRAGSQNTVILPKYVHPTSCNTKYTCLCNSQILFHRSCKTKNFDFSL